MRKRKTGPPRSYPWDEIKPRYESGELTIVGVCKAYGCCASAVRQRRDRDGWKKPPLDKIPAKSAEYRLGQIAKEEGMKVAVEASIELQRDVIRRHRREWEQHRPLIDDAIAKRDFDLGRVAKITAETLIIRHKGEQLCWGLKLNPEESQARDETASKAGRLPELDSILEEWAEGKA